MASFLYIKNIIYDNMTEIGVCEMRYLDYKFALSVIHVDATIVSDDRWALNPQPRHLL